MMRRFVGIDLGRRPVPDETTVMRFRHLLQQHGLGRRLFKTVNRMLRKKGLLLHQGTIVDATIISSQSSTQNEDGARDPEMHQTRTGQQWYFGMKPHIGVDAASTLIHSIDVTPENVHDGKCIANLLHGKARMVCGDQGYVGGSEAIAEHAPKARDLTNERVREWEVDDPAHRRNRRKSKIRSRVEHAFHRIKRVFGFCKTRLRGMVKNTNRLYGTCALANLHRRRYRLAT